MEWVVPLLERMCDVLDEGVSDDGWRIWRGRIFWDGCWNLGVGPVLPSPIKMGFGVENRENRGETMTLSMLYKWDESEPRTNRNVEVTHDKHAQRTGQEPNACNQNTFELGFELLRHRSAAPAEHEPARGKRGRQRRTGMRNKELERKLLSELRANGDQLILDISARTHNSDVEAQLTGQGPKTPRV